MLRMADYSHSPSTRMARKKSNKEPGNLMYAVWMVGWYGHGHGYRPPPPPLRKPGLIHPSAATVVGMFQARFLKRKSSRKWQFVGLEASRL
jgi:hypothetical protein